MTETEVVFKLTQKVYDETKLALEILHLLAEVFERKIHLKRRYPSLHEFCVKELKYTDGQTFRRIKAMQLLKSFPECEQKIEQGSLSLTNAASAQNYFIQNKITSVSEKAEILKKIENKSSRETERVFKELGSQLAKRKIEIDEETFQLLKELQAFRSHKEQKIGEMIKAVMAKELAAEKRSVLEKTTLWLSLKLRFSQI